MSCNENMHEDRKMAIGVCQECWSKEAKGEVDQRDGLFYCFACWHAFEQQQERQCNMTGRLLSSGGDKDGQFATDKGNQKKNEAQSKPRLMGNKQPEARPNKWKYQHEEADRTAKERMGVKEKTAAAAAAAVHTRKQAKTETQSGKHNKKDHREVKDFTDGLVAEDIVQNFNGRPSVLLKKEGEDTILSLKPENLLEVREEIAAASADAAAEQSTKQSKKNKKRRKKAANVEGEEQLAADAAKIVPHLERTLDTMSLGGIQLTTDRILADLKAELDASPESDYCAQDSNIRLFHHPDVSATISVYKEDGKTWLQYRIGYISGPPAQKKLDFVHFINLSGNNPKVLSTGREFDMCGMFVNEYDDDKHRFGADHILDDMSLHEAAELLDYLLTTKYPSVAGGGVGSCRGGDGKTSKARESGPTENRASLDKMLVSSLSDKRQEHSISNDHQYNVAWWTDSTAGAGRAVRASNADETMGGVNSKINDQQRNVSISNDHQYNVEGNSNRVQHMSGASVDVTCLLPDPPPLPIPRRDGLFVSVARGVTSFDTEGNKYTAYVLRCSNVVDGERVSWEVKRRFKEFFTLHTELKRNGTVVAELPYRNPFGMMSSVVRRREIGLQEYLQSVLNHCNDKQGTYLAKFLQVQKHLISLPPPSVSSMLGVRALRLGNLVMLHSLKKSEHFNGEKAVVVDLPRPSCDERTEDARYSVQLLESVSSVKVIRVLPCNVELLFSDVYSSKKSENRNSSFTVLNQSCAPCAEETPRYYRVPVIGTNGGQYTYTRLRGKRKIESWIEDDLDEIVHLTQMHAELWEEEISIFRKELAVVLIKLCPDCEIVEAGSSGRGTSVFPMSDIDMVCLIPLKDSVVLRSMLPELKRKFDMMLEENHPTWQMDGEHIAVKVIKPISATHHALANGRIFADVLFGCAGDSRTTGVHSASHAKARQAALEGLPEDLRTVSKILKVVLKAHQWPSKSAKPPSYMVDVVMKFLWDGGPACDCSECGAMMLRGSRRDDVKGMNCALCRGPLGVVSFVCSTDGCGRRMCSTEECISLKKTFKSCGPIFRPSREQYESKPREKFGMRYNNIHWAFDNVYPPVEPKPFGLLQWVVYFFLFCSHFERIAISANGTEISEGVCLPYIQDPGCLSNNIVERLDYKPFLEFCWDMVDNSGDGFISLCEYLEPRRKFFSPFASIFTLGIKIAVNLYLPEYEDIFVVFVDPRWSFNALFNAFGCRGDRTQRRGCSQHACPNVIMHNPSIATMLLFSASGSIKVTSDHFHLPMITYRVSFGSYIWFFEGTVEEVDDGKGNDGKSQEEGLNMHSGPENLRQHRFEWTTTDTYIDEKFFCDSKTGAQCFFHPSLNKCRAFGPDFYY